MNPESTLARLRPNRAAAIGGLITTGPAHTNVNGYRAPLLVEG